MEEVALQRLIALKKLLTCLKRDVFSVRSVPSNQTEVVGKWKKLTTSSTALSYVLESMQQPSLTKNTFRENKTQPQTSSFPCHLSMFQRMELLLFSPVPLHLWFVFHLKIQQSP